MLQVPEGIDRSTCYEAKSAKFYIRTIMTFTSCADQSMTEQNSKSYRVSKKILIQICGHCRKTIIAIIHLIVFWEMMDMLWFIWKITAQHLLCSRQYATWSKLIVSLWFCPESGHDGLSATVLDMAVYQLQYFVLVYSPIITS